MHYFKSIVPKKYNFIMISIKIFTSTIFILLIYSFLSISKGKNTFFIPSSSYKSLYDTLEDNNYSMHIVDHIILPFITVPKEGWYKIDKTIKGRFAFFSSLHLQKTKTQQVKIYAGETAEELCKRLRLNLNLDTEKLLKIYQKYTRFGDGDIFASLYNIAPTADEKSTISYLFYRSNIILEKFEKEYEKIRDDKIEHKILLTIASIIQKESNHVEEMPIISSVIYNRLEKNMKLQMDGILNYGKYSHKIIDSNRIKTDTSAYNTYKHKGLPPTPLCTISIEALEAAHLPQTTEYLFFMLNKKGTHNFAVTYKEHLKNIHKFKTMPKSKKIFDTNLSKQ